MYSRNKTKKVHLILITILIVVIMLVSAGRTTYLSTAVNFVTTPVYSFFNGVNNFFGNTFEFIGNIGKLSASNKSLIEENNQLKLENNILKIYKEENDDLRKLLSLKDGEGYDIIGAAEIIAMPSTNWNTTFIINKGQNDGVANNMIAINHQGLIGRVVEVNETSSKIRPIVDERNSVSAMISRNGEKVMVKGNSLSDNKNTCKLEYITLDADILEGDDVVTSYISEIYPRGIVVGKVKKVEIDKTMRKKEVLVTPAVDFDKLEKVIIIENKEIEGMETLSGEQS